MSKLQEDYNWLQKHDPYFDFESFEEWVAFLEETKEDRDADS